MGCTEDENSPLDNTAADTETTDLTADSTTEDTGSTDILFSDLEADMAEDSSTDPTEDTPSHDSDDLSSSDGTGSSDLFVGDGTEDETDLATADAGSTDILFSDLEADMAEDSTADEPDAILPLPDLTEEDTVVIDLSDGLCPPSGPFGFELGDIPEDITLTDCEGTPYNLHDLCAFDASLIFFYAEWCPSCVDFIRSGDAEAIYEDYADDNFEMWVVATEDADYEPSDALHCRSLSTRFGISMRVLYDPEDALQRAFSISSNSWSVVMEHGLSITFKDQYATDDVPHAIDEALLP
jgi:hypothetical protein